MDAVVRITDSHAAVPDGRVLMYDAPGAVLVTNRRFPSRYRLMAHYRDVAAVARDLRRNPRGEVRYDTALRGALIRCYGVDAVADGDRIKLFDGAALMEETPVKAPCEEQRRIPYDVRAYVSDRLGEYLDGLDEDSAVAFLWKTVNLVGDDGRGRHEEVVSRGDIRDILSYGGKARVRLLAAATVAHYLHRWVEVMPGDWRFVSWKDISAEGCILRSIAADCRAENERVAKATFIKIKKRI